MGKVVISSGGAVYGTPQYLPLDESRPDQLSEQELIPPPLTLPSIPCTFI